MCITVVIGGEHCGNVGELRKVIFPSRPVFLPEYKTPFRDRDCLCPLDIDKTAALLGLFACREEGWDPMEIHLLKLEEIGEKFVRLDPDTSDIGAA